INWVGGEVVIHLHSIVDAIALLGRNFAPTQAELARARRTKADRFLWFDEAPGDAVFDGKFNAPMLWNSNFFMTLESMKIPAHRHRRLAARFQIRARPLHNDSGEDAMVLGNGDAQHCAARRMG